MITEIAVVDIVVGQEKDFETSLGVAVSTVLPQAKGFLSFNLHRGIESPSTYTFLIEWNTLEDHTIGFRESDLFLQWRALIGKHFASPPRVEHWESIAF
ncbi:MAG: antibiotic biosynthesis monooxygenase [Actinobacteria bacterium]|nr:antibiotic biosynthesis monooxygenase [Actinomycetota bacterium]